MYGGVDMMLYASSDCMLGSHARIDPINDVDCFATVCIKSKDT